MYAYLKVKCTHVLQLCTLCTMVQQAFERPSWNYVVIPQYYIYVCGECKCKVVFEKNGKMLIFYLFPALQDENLSSIFSYFFIFSYIHILSFHLSFSYPDTDNVTQNIQYTTPQHQSRQRPSIYPTRRRELLILSLNSIPCLQKTQ